MKREVFLRHLLKYGCNLLREGGRHSWWLYRELTRRSVVPRHREIDDQLARKICKDLGIPTVK
ncbi:MAG: type II toxin-antitoxin system HicA family toxin [Deltaproteobacteria bacterium]|nr:type II toxin-antitoxin system HicA family toxin [Deltaproteobacteria bacterium]